MSEIFHDLVVPYLGPGFCCALSCQYFQYESFHKPMQGCKGFENFKEIENNKMIVDPKFSLHKFMDFYANQKWKCFNKKCPISWSEPFHCQGDARCISFPKFCEYFNIPVSHKMRDTVFQSHKMDPEPKKVLRKNISENKKENYCSINVCKIICFVQYLQS